MHRAIAARWFSALGPVARPVRRLHDGVSDAVYGSVRVGGIVAGTVAESRMRRNSVAAESAQSVVNGLWGDNLGPGASGLEIEMSIRDASGAIVSANQELADVFRGATEHLVVLVHGLIETERCWAGVGSDSGLFELLDDHRDLTPVMIRYNSGLRVSDNGAHLAALIEDIRSFWPVPVESISLVGHSAGGLVIRSACAVAADSGSSWIDHVDRVVTIGTPHRGAPLEKLVNATAWALDVAPETRPLADFLNARSVGIKDLRFGAIVEDDWRGGDPDALLRNTVADSPLPAGIEHHFVAGVITEGADHPIGYAAGDLVVRTSSAQAQGYLVPTTSAVFSKTRHTTLQRSPAVVEHVMACLTDS